MGVSVSRREYTSAVPQLVLRVLGRNEHVEIENSIFKIKMGITLNVDHALGIMFLATLVSIGLFVYERKRMLPVTRVVEPFVSDMKDARIALVPASELESYEFPDIEEVYTNIIQEARDVVKIMERSTPTSA
jgi:hypothetical protein